MGKQTGRSSSKTSSKKNDSETVSKKKKTRGTKFGAKKGKQFEREIATALGHIFPDAQRMLEYQGSNVIGVDLEKTDIFRFQCKCWANYANPNTIFEIREKEPHVPVLVTKANNRPPMAVLPFEEFVTLLERAYGHRERLINPYYKKSLEAGALSRAYLPPGTIISPTNIIEVKDYVAEVDAKIIDDLLEEAKDPEFRIPEPDLPKLHKFQEELQLKLDIASFL